MHICSFTDTRQYLALDPSLRAALSDHALITSFIRARYAVVQGLDVSAQGVVILEKRSVGRDAVVGRPGVRGTLFYSGVLCLSHREHLLETCMV